MAVSRDDAILLSVPDLRPSAKKTSPVATTRTLRAWPSPVQTAMSTYSFAALAS